MDTGTTGVDGREWSQQEVSGRGLGVSPAAHPSFPVCSFPAPFPCFRCSSFSPSHTEAGARTQTAGLWATRLNTTTERMLDITWSNPSLFREGAEAQRGEGPSPRSHSTPGAGPGIKPRSLSSCPVLLSPCSSWPLSPAPSPCLHHVSWGRGLEGMDVGGSSYPWRPLPAPSCSSSHCHLLANGTRQLRPDPQFRREAA